MNKSGLNLTAFPVVPNGTLPQKFANGRVKLHLCTTETCTAGKSGAYHLGEWAYVGDGDEGEATGDAERLLQALGPDGVQRVNGSEDDAETDTDGKAPVPDPQAKAGAVRFAMDGQLPVTPKPAKPAGAIAKWCSSHDIFESSPSMFSSSW